MRPRTILILASVFCLTATVATAQVTVYVSPTGSDTTGDGTAGNPYLTIQTGFLNAANGDTVRVMPGTYNECVDATWVAAGGNPGDPGVHLVADAWLTSADNTVTIIDGTGQCSDPLAAVNIWGSDASLQGFTVTGAVASGVYARGNVQVSNNLITGNDSSIGGGIFFYPGTCYYGNVTARFNNNLITNNRALWDASLGDGGDGGGIFVNAEAPDIVNNVPTCGDVLLTIDNNTIQNNTANRAGSPGVNVPFGAGIAVQANTADTTVTDVRITQNTLVGNAVQGDASYGYGGGIWTSTYGFGHEYFTIQDNDVLGNTSTGDGGGISAWIQSFELGLHKVIVDGNTVSGNTATGNGGGMDLFMISIELLPVQAMQMFATDNVVTGNSASGNLGGGGGILGTLASWRSSKTISIFRFDIQGNRVTNNTSRLMGGGISSVIGADADPVAIPGTMLLTDARIRLFNNLVANNTVTDNSGTGGGIFNMMESIGNAFASSEIVLNTVTGNTSPAGSGGIEIESSAQLDPNNIQDGANDITLSSNIVSDNSSFGIGGPRPGQPGLLVNGSGFFNLTALAEYTDLWNDDIRTGLGIQENSNYGLDPMLDPLTFIPDQCSPTLDAADPAFDASAEPEPNNDRVNLGHTGGTAQARASLADINGDKIVDGIDVVLLSGAFSALPMTPRFVATSDFDGDGDIDGDDLSYIAGQFATDCN